MCLPNNEEPDKLRISNSSAPPEEREAEQSLPATWRGRCAQRRAAAEACSPAAQPRAAPRPEPWRDNLDELLSVGGRDAPSPAAGALPAAPRGRPCDIPAAPPQQGISREDGVAREQFWNFVSSAQRQPLRRPPCRLPAAPQGARREGP